MCEQRKAFTLVELLVVIAIISLLLAVLIPCLVTAREIARKIICGKRLNQLVIAQTMYAEQDSEKRFTICFGDEKEPYKVWQLRLDKILPLKDKSEQFTQDRCDLKSIYCCPLAKFTDFQVQQCYASYGLNNHINSKYWSYKATNVKRPSETLLVADMNEYNYDVVASSEGNMWWGWKYEARPGFRHRDKANVGFVDCHIDTKKTDELEFGKPIWWY